MTKVKTGDLVSVYVRCGLYHSIHDPSVKGLVITNKSTSHVTVWIPFKGTRKVPFNDIKGIL